jgi:hypothetical protein
VNVLVCTYVEHFVETTECLKNTDTIGGVTEMAFQVTFRTENNNFSIRLRLPGQMKSKMARTECTIQKRKVNRYEEMRLFNNPYGSVP